jgi:hypothetical protein
MGAATMSPRNKSAWHLDKRVPLALMVTIGLQTGGVIWWTSSLNERVSSLERNAVATAPQGDRLTRVEVKIENIQSGVNEIKALLRPQRMGGPDQ